MRIMSTWRSKVRVLLSEIFICLANKFNKFLITGLKIILNKTLDMHLYSMYSLDTLDTLHFIIHLSSAGLHPLFAFIITLILFGINST